MAGSQLAPEPLAHLPCDTRMRLQAFISRACCCLFHMFLQTRMLQTTQYIKSSTIMPMRQAGLGDAGGTQPCHHAIQLHRSHWGCYIACTLMRAACFESSGM